MTWQEALDEIQSVKFDVALNIVSSTDKFFDVVSEEPAVLSACVLMQKSGELREDTLNILRDLVTRESDPMYENPYDTSLAVLLWLTNFAAQDHSQVAASWVDQAARCWHAKRLAQRILNPPPSQTANPESWGQALHSLGSSTSHLHTENPWVQLAGQRPRIQDGSPTIISSTPVSWVNEYEGAKARSVGTS
jgi:hypothetical protein